LDAYAKKAREYVAKYSKFQMDGEEKGLMFKNEISAKAGLAEKTVAALKDLVQQQAEQEAKAKADKEARDKAEKSAQEGLSHYARSEFDADSKAIEPLEREARYRGIKLVASGTSVTFDEDIMKISFDTEKNIGKSWKETRELAEKAADELEKACDT